MKIGYVMYVCIGTRLTNYLQNFEMQILRIPFKIKLFSKYILNIQNEIGYVMYVCIGKRLTNSLKILRSRRGLVGSVLAY